MTRKRSSGEASLSEVPPTPAERLRDIADALYRTACECCRLHARYARLMESGALQGEQDAACQAAEHGDDTLEQMMLAYQAHVSEHGSPGDSAWWHRANMLLHAAREYTRHRHRCDQSTTQIRRRSSETFAELTLEFELAASAMMALRQALDAYQQVRPDADLTSAAPPPAA